MKLNITFILLICTSILSYGQQTINASITHDELQRDYILYVPANYTGTSAVPLVLNFHGYTSNAFQQMVYGSFSSIADTEGFIVVHPEGTLDGTGTTHFNVGWGGSTVDDIGFTSNLIDSLSAEYNINSERIYSTGMSNGGFMSYHLACNLSDRIAAIASVTGSMSPVTYNACDPQHPMPVLEIHGTADGVVPYVGGTFAKPIDEVVQYWVNYNNCNATAASTDLPDISTTDMSTVEHYVYDDGDNEVNTELFKVIDGGHQWPGSAINFTGMNHDINASAEIWKFFSKYDINGRIPTTDIDQTVNDFGVHIYPNPAHSHLSIDSDISKPTPYELTSTLGELLMSGIIQSAHETLDISHLSPNIYFLKIGDSTHKVLKNE